MFVSSLIVSYLIQIHGEFMFGFAKSMFYKESLTLHVSHPMNINLTIGKVKGDFIVQTFSD